MFIHDTSDNFSREELSSISRYAARVPPIMYLGCPLVHGRRNLSMYEHLISKVRKMIAGWHNTLLSPTGKFILIRHVLLSIPIDTLSACSPPKSVLDQIERCFASFFWGRTKGIYRRHWSSWNWICRPTVEEGLGVRRLTEVVDAFSILLWWKIRIQKSL